MVWIQGLFGLRVKHNPISCSLYEEFTRLAWPETRLAQDTLDYIKHYDLGSCRCALVGVPCRLRMLSTSSTFDNRPVPPRRAARAPPPSQARPAGGAGGAPGPPEGGLAASAWRPARPAQGIFRARILTFVCAAFAEALRRVAEIRFAETDICSIENEQQVLRRLSETTNLRKSCADKMQTHNSTNEHHSTTNNDATNNTNTTGSQIPQASMPAFLVSPPMSPASPRRCVAVAGATRLD